MSAQPQTTYKLSAEDYLVWEAAQPERHEFVDGEVFAMAGAEDRHVTVTGNVYMALRQHLRGTPCRTFMADMKVQAHADSSYFYPDVLVTCSAADADSRQIKREPRLIVEVLSPGTEAYDRGEKFVRYREQSGSDSNFCYLRRPLRKAYGDCTQFSSRRPGTRSNSRVLCVTRGASKLRAWAAIMVSRAPIGWPWRSRFARKSPYAQSALVSKGSISSGARNISSAALLRAERLLATP